MSRGKSSGKGRDKQKDQNLKGRSGDDLLDGADGHDKLTGGAGHDTMAGGSGDDRLVGGSGNDLMDGGGAIVGGALVALAGADGSDRVDGGAGNDTLVWRPAANQGEVDSYTGGSGWDTLRVDLSAADFALYETALVELMDFLSTAKRDGKAEVAGGKHGRYLLELGTGRLQIEKIDNLEVIVDGVVQPIPAAPSILRGDLKAEVVEGGPLADSGHVRFLDLNFDETHTVSATLVGADPALGTLTVSVLEDSTGDGIGQLQWDYLLDDTLVQSLGADDDVEQVYELTITDSSGLSTTRRLVVEIEGRNDAPVATDDAYATAVNTALVIAAPGVLGNDTDIDADTLLLGSVDVAGLKGTLVTLPDGGFSFQPTVGFVGVTSFAYQVSDGAGGVDSGMVTITVG